MNQGSKARTGRKWYDSAHASLCMLGAYLRLGGFFQPLEQQVSIKQKVRRYTPAEKLRMLFVSLLAGARAVSHTGFTLRTDRALQAAFGLAGCAEQSVIAQTLDAATAREVAALQAAIGAIFIQHSQARRHRFDRALLVLDVDLSPLPASRHAEGSTKGYMGRNRSKTGRKLVRVRASQYQETVWEAVREGRLVESLALVQEVVRESERLLGLDDDAARAKRERTEWRMDSGFGSEATIAWLLARGYHVTGKFKWTLRLPKLVAPIAAAAWVPTELAGREAAPLPQPLAFVRAVQQYAVRTPSQEKAGGFQHAIVFSSRTDLALQGVVRHYDARAGMEADLKSDKQGLGLAGWRKQKLAAQTVLVLLVSLAHNVLVWSRRWLAQQTPSLAQFGIVRLVQQVWAVPGRVKLQDDQLLRVRLRRSHPLATLVLQGLTPLLGTGQTLALLD